MTRSSLLTAWEMSIQVALGKLNDSNGALARFSALLVERGMTELPISPAHAVLAGGLPRVHRDPFDRMLVAQSRIEELPVVTNDPVFRKYGGKVLW